MGEFFRIFPSITGLCCPPVKSREMILICLHFPQKGQKRLVLLKSRAGRGKFCETHDLRGENPLNSAENMTELTGKLGLKPLYHQIAAPTVYTKLCVLFLLHDTSQMPCGVFNCNLSLQECLSCISAILFPLFWHLKATSVSPQHFHQKEAALQLLQSAPFAGL